MMDVDINEAETPHRKVRRECKYTQQEMNQILPFKNSYINAGTSQERLLILKTQIMVNMFNYWTQNGDGPKSEEETQVRAKVRT